MKEEKKETNTLVFKLNKINYTNSGKKNNNKHFFSHVN